MEYPPEKVKVTEGNTVLHTNYNESLDNSGSNMINNKLRKTEGQFLEAIIVIRYKLEKEKGH